VGSLPGYLMREGFTAGKKTNAGISLDAFIFFLKKKDVKWLEFIFF
jgi:hypothetical protein